MENIVYRPSTSSSAIGPSHLESGQLIWKMYENIKINIVDWLFTQVIWNRPISSGKEPAHVEKSKRKDQYLVVFCIFFVVFVFMFGCLTQHNHSFSHTSSQVPQSRKGLSIVPLFPAGSHLRFSFTQSRFNWSGAFTIEQIVLQRVLCGKSQSAKILHLLI